MWWIAGPGRARACARPRPPRLRSHGPFVKLLVAASGAGPGEILLHGIALDGLPTGAVDVVDVDGALQGVPESARAVFDEGEAGEGVLDGVRQAAGGAHHGDAAVAH